MVKAYKTGMPRTYQYSQKGKYQIKVVGNLSSAVFSGIANNGLADVLVSIDSLDKNLQILDDGAFNGCISLTHANLSSTGLLQIRNSAFQDCTSLNEVEFGQNVDSIGLSCFNNCASLSVLSPYSYEHDATADIPIVESQLTQFAASSLYGTLNLNCFVLPYNVNANTLDIDAFYGAHFQHVVFRGSDIIDDELIHTIEDTQMFGLQADCTFEDGTTDEVYNYKNGIVELIENTNSLFNMSVEALPANMSDLMPRHIYEYDQQYVQYCMYGGKNFIVVYIDSKTSAKTKRFLQTDNIMQLFISDNAPDAIVFLLDRKACQINTENIAHYRKQLMNQIAAQQKLIHSSTDTSAILDFPELSFVGYSGLKFQKVQLSCNDYTVMQQQINAAAKNVFSKLS